jgi:hypothetical protein
MNKKELVEMASAEAKALYYFGNGTVGFFAPGICKAANAIGGPISFTPEGGPGRRWLASRNPDGSWRWLQNKDTEATRKLETLGYRWDEKGEEWRLSEKTIPGEVMAIEIGR